MNIFKKIVAFLALSLSFGVSGQTKVSDPTDSINNLKPVIIIAKQQSPERMPEIKDNVLFAGKKNEVLRLTNINGNLTKNNSREIFSRVPGVSIWENEGSGLQINVGVRGLSPNRSWELNTRQNGVDMSSDVFGYPEAYYNPPLEAVETIQLVRGGASLQFGPQFGGMLNYVLKRETKNDFSFETQNSVGSFQQMSSFNAIGGTLKKWSYYIYNQSRSGKSWRKNNQYHASNTFAFLEYRFKEDTKISIEYTLSDYKMQQPGGMTDDQFANNPQESNRNRNWFGVPWQIFALHFNTKLNQNFDAGIKVFGLIGSRNSVGFIGAANTFDLINTSTNQYSNRQVDVDDYRNIGLENRNLYKYKFNKIDNNLAFGFRIYKAETDRKQKAKGTFGNDFDLSTEGLFQSELKFVTNNFAFFAENQFKINEKFSITPGIRFENINSVANGRINISSTINEQKRERNKPLFGLGLEYKIKTTNIYANITQAFRPVLFSDLTPSATTDVIDSNLKDASGFNADLGYRGTYKGFINFDFSLFYLSYTNRIGGLRKYTDNDPTKPIYLFKTNLGETVNKGIESFFDINLTKMIGIDKQFGAVDFFSSMSFIDSKYVDSVVTTVTVTGVPPISTIVTTNLAGNRVENAPRYIHNFGLSYTKNGFSATMQYRMSGEIFTDANNTLIPSANGQVGILEGYKVADFSTEYKFLRQFNVRSGINNVFNAMYATRRSGGYPGPGILPGEGRSFYVSIGAKF
jgi:Fe(3+) dicitrate transport protein